MTNKLLELGDELDRESATWLEENQPLIFDALEVAVIRGVLPEEVKAYILRHVGPHRAAFVERCEQAARYLLTQKAKE